MYELDSENRQSNSGFSLIELLIVITIIGISVGIATFSFNDFNSKSRVEAQVKQMAADISELRIRALTTKQRHSITLNEFSYVFKSYSSETFTGAALATKGTVIPGGTHEVGFAMKNEAGTSYSGTVLEIDERGLNSSALEATVNFFGNGVSKAVPNCLKIHTIRTNVGKQNSSGGCDDQ